MTRPGAYLAGLLRRFRRDQRGAAAIIVAVLMPVFIGGIGLGVETGYWFMWERKLQHIADVAAYAGAVERRSGGDSTDISNAVSNIATASGYPAGASAPVVVNPFGGNDLAVEVTLSHNLSRLFTGVFLSGDVAISARAVAAIDPAQPEACITVMSPDSAGAMTVWGSAIVTLNGCDLVSASNASNSIMLGNDLNIDNGCPYAVGGLSGAHNLNLTNTSCTGVQSITSIPDDPHADLTLPTTSDCGTMWNGQLVRCYNDLRMDDEDIHSDSIYIIDGELSVRARSDINATNITFIVNDSSVVDLQNNSEMHLSAPTSGPLSGMLIYGLQSGLLDSRIENRIRGTINSSFEGTVYLPNAHLEYLGNASLTCTALVAHSITFTGNSEMNCTNERKFSTDLTLRGVSLIE